MLHQFTFKQYLTTAAIIFVLVISSALLAQHANSYSIKFGGIVACSLIALVLLKRIFFGRRNPKFFVAVGLMAAGSTTMLLVLGGDVYWLSLPGFSISMSKSNPNLDTLVQISALIVSALTFALAARLMLHIDNSKPTAIHPEFDGRWAEIVRKSTPQTPSDDKEEIIKKISDELFIDLRQLVKMYVEPEIQLVNPSDRHESDLHSAIKQPVGKYLEQFLSGKFIERDGSHVLFVLSDAGMGKSSLLAMLAATKFAKRNWPDSIDLEFFKLGSDTLHRISEVHRCDQKILLLDALDEDPAASGRIEARLAELLKATRGFRQVIITVRTQFLPKSSGEVREGETRIELRGYRCNLIYLSPFDDKKIGEYLRKVYPPGPIQMVRFFFTGLESERVQRARIVMSKMHSLKMRPMLLQHIDELVGKFDQNSKLSAFEVYDELVSVWLAREERKSNGVVTSKTLLEASTKLALRIHGSNKRTISESDLEAFSRDHQNSFDSLKAIDLKGRSLINRNSNRDWRFSHYSIQEFLVIKWFLNLSDSERISVDQDLRMNSLYSVTELMVEFISSSSVKTLVDDKGMSCFDFSNVDKRGVKFDRINFLSAHYKEGNLRIGRTTFTIRVGENMGNGFVNMELVGVGSVIWVQFHFFDKGDIELIVGYMAHIMLCKGWSDMEIQHAFETHSFSDAIGHDTTAYFERFRSILFNYKSLMLRFGSLETPIFERDKIVAEFGLEVL